MYKLERDWQEKNVALEKKAGYALEARVARPKKLFEADNGRVWRAYMKLRSLRHRGKKLPDPFGAATALSVEPVPDPRHGHHRSENG